MPIQIISKMLNISMTEASKFWTFLCKMLQPDYAIEIVQTRPLFLTISYEQFKIIEEMPMTPKMLADNSTFVVMAMAKNIRTNKIVARGNDNVAKAELKDKPTSTKALATLKSAEDNVVSFNAFKEKK